MIIDNSTCKLIEDFPGYCVDINGGIWTCWTTGRKMTNVWRRLNERSYMQTNEDKAVETAKLLLIDIEVTHNIEHALRLCYKIGYLEGQYDMENSINPVSCKT